MAVFNSDQVALTEGKPTAKIPASQRDGEVRILFFSFDNTGGTALASGDSIRLGPLPKTARILRGEVAVTSAFSAGNLTFGVDGSASKFGSAAAGSTGSKSFAATVTDGGLLTTEVGEQEILATAGAALGNGAFTGFVEYVQG